MQKVSERSQRLLDNMSDIIRNMNRGHDTLDELMTRMREYATAVLEAKDIQARPSLWVTDKRIHMAIDDDGAGSDRKELHHLGGQRNMQHRAEEMRGTLEIVSAPASGTRVSLSVPR